jgi:hypothetical protein
MRQPAVDDFVRLNRDIPELALSRGQVGVICGRQCQSNMVYEVDFHLIGHDMQIHAILAADDMQVVEGSLFEQPLVAPLA